jgi:hypothetical protein
LGFVLDQSGIAPVATAAAVLALLSALLLAGKGPVAT